MFLLQIESAAGDGRETVGGSAADKADILCENILGLSLPPRSYNNIDYISAAGQGEAYRKDSARTITALVDVFRSQKGYDNLLKLLHGDVWLKFDLNGKKRKIKAKLLSVSDPKRGVDMNSVVVQWVCDNPYFRDWENTSANAFGRFDHIGEDEGMFSLPMVFTSRVTEAALINEGYFPVEPIVHISVQKRLGASGGSGGIVLENITTGETVSFDYPLSADTDKITVNVPERIVVSKELGVITNLLSADSFLHRFVLEPGLNELKVTNLNTNYHTTATVEYCHRYVECEYTKE